MKISETIIENHGLKKEEYKNIQKILKRDPNILELGVFSAMWNEHCSYKSQEYILKNYLLKENRLYKDQVKMQV